MENFKPKKFPNIPVQQNYSGELHETFWEKFPHCDMPLKPETKIDIETFEEIMEASKPKLLDSEYERAVKCIDYLRHGAPSFQAKDLPACAVKNSETALKHGEQVSDVIANWVNKGYASGPFKSPPVKNFRANSILAVEQPGKIRVCLNVSLPEGKSLNDNVIPNSLEKIKMTSAKQFGYAILRAGKNATMLKFDKADAYKNVPAKIKDLNIQGFCWGNRYFVETRQMFGAKASVQNYDLLGNSSRAIVLTDCKIPKNQVLRQLDDVPAVAPNGSGWCEEFLTKYKNFCNLVNLELASPCPNFDKAFECTKFGKILGICFDTRDMSWKLPKEKTESYLRTITEVIVCKEVELKQMQTLMGKLNNVSQMCPFLNSFKHPLNLVLSNCIKNGTATLTEQALSDLKIWSCFLQNMNHGMPITPPRFDPPICTKVFCSDAAGFPKNGKWGTKIGCGVVGVDELDDTMLAFQLWWPKDLMTQRKDSKGSKFGCKTATLEMIGILLPFLLIPKRLERQHVVIQVDNISCVYGFENHYMKGDVCASILIRALHLIEAYLGSTIHVQHVPRCSTWESKVADNLSREKTTGFLEKQMLSRYKHLTLPSKLTEWLNNPEEDWSLAISLLNHVEDSCK